MDEYYNYGTMPRASEKILDQVSYLSSFTGNQNLLEDKLEYGEIRDWHYDFH